jgi:serine/threonine-protein kinase
VSGLATKEATPSLRTDVAALERPTTPELTISGDPLAGRSFDHYEVRALIAQGGMGVVYQAWDRRVGRLVALKMMRAGVLARPEEVERFGREAQAVVQLSHPHIVQVYDFGQSDGRPYFTMLLAPGGSLAQHLARFGADPRVAVALVEKVARAVQHAHSKGILHRDLKPANVLLGEGDEPLVSDFGLAKFMHTEGDALTQSGVTPGTPAYMAPEQAAGRRDEVGPRTDVWALGVILYELLTGQRPITGQSREDTLHRILTTEVPPLRSLRPGLDPALETVVLRCLEKQPARRYGTAEALAGDLGRWLRGELPPEAPARPAPRPEKRRRWPIAAAVLAVAAALSAGAGLLWEMARPAVPVQPGENPPLVLIGPRGAPSAPRWILGADGAVPGPADEGFSFNTPKTAVVELLAAPPWEAYHLEAEVQHTAARRGTVGIYFGYADCPPVQPSCHLLCSIGFAAQGTFRGQMDMRLWRMPDDAPAQYAIARWPVHTFDKVVPAGAGRAWHKLAADVYPGTVSLYFNDQCVRTLPSSEIGRQGATLFADVPLDWATVPRGGVGLYMDEDGSATFRNVLVRPLGQAP